MLVKSQGVKAWTCFKCLKECKCLKCSSQNSPSEEVVNMAMEVIKKEASLAQSQKNNDSGLKINKAPPKLVLSTKGFEICIICSKKTCIDSISAIKCLKDFYSLVEIKLVKQDSIFLQQNGQFIKDFLQNQENASTIPFGEKKQLCSSCLETFMKTEKSFLTLLGALKRNQLPIQEKKQDFEVGKKVTNDLESLIRDLKPKTSPICFVIIKLGQAR